MWPFKKTQVDISINPETNSFAISSNSKRTPPFEVPISDFVDRNLKYRSEMLRGILGKYYKENMKIQVSEEASALIDEIIEMSRIFH